MGVIKKYNVCSIVKDQIVTVFNSAEWQNVGDVGNNDQFWQSAKVLKTRFKNEWLADVQFVKSGLISHGHFVQGIKLEKER